MLSPLLNLRPWTGLHLLRRSLKMIGASAQQRKTKKARKGKKLPSPLRQSRLSPVIHLLLWQSKAREFLALVHHLLMIPKPNNHRLSPLLKSR